LHVNAAELLTHEPLENILCTWRKAQLSDLAASSWCSLQAVKASWLQRLLDYKLLVSEEMLAQGISNVGDSRRMERFLQKLLNSTVLCIRSLLNVIA
jgi:hypothetical protein